MADRKVIHFDQGDVLRYEKTPEGFLNCYMRVAKVGDLQYRNADGTTRTEYVSPETLFNADSAKTLKMKPITFEHPPSLLDASTAKSYTRGSTGHLVVPDASFLGVSAVIHDKETIDAILSGKAREVSCGYTCDLRKRSDGKYEQINREYNHVAVTRKGRAGSDVAVHMDSIANDKVWTQVREDSMSEFQLDFANGVVRVDAETYNLVKQERLDMEKKMNAMQAKMAKLRAMQGKGEEEDMEDEDMEDETMTKKDASCNKKGGKKYDSDDESDEDLSRIDSVDQEMLKLMVENKLLRDRTDAKAKPMPEEEMEDEEDEEDVEEMKRKDAADVLNTWLAVSSELTPALIRGDAFIEGVEVEDGELRFDSVSATDIKEAYIKLNDLDSVLVDSGRFDSLAIDTVFAVAQKTKKNQEPVSQKNRATLDSAAKNSVHRSDADDVRMKALRADIEASRKPIGR